MGRFSSGSSSDCRRRSCPQLSRPVSLSVLSSPLLSIYISIFSNLIQTKFPLHLFSSRPFVSERDTPRARLPQERAWREERAWRYLPHLGTSRRHFCLYFLAEPFRFFIGKQDSYTNPSVPLRSLSFSAFSLLTCDLSRLVYKKRNLALRILFQHILRMKCIYRTAAPPPRAAQFSNCRNERALLVWKESKNLSFIVFVCQCSFLSLVSSFDGNRAPFTSRH